MFIGYKQTDKQTNKQTDKPNLFIDVLINKWVRNKVKALPVKKTNKSGVPRIKFVDLNI